MVLDGLSNGWKSREAQESTEENITKALAEAAQESVEENVTKALAEDAQESAEENVTKTLAEDAQQSTEENVTEKMVEDFRIAHHQKALEVADKYRSGDPKCDPVLLAMPEHIKIKICEFLLVKKLVNEAVNEPVNARNSADICPFYYEGFHPDPSVFNEEELSAMTNYGWPHVYMKGLPNVELHLLRVNKYLNQFASKVYYSKNTFLFNDARSCFWFLKQIGPRNVSYIRNAVFNLSSGFFLSMAHRSDSDICEERRWCQVFEFLKPNHGLRNCVIRFYEWNFIDPREDLSQMDKKRMTKGRLDLVAILAGFRGMERVRIENDFCIFLASKEIFQICCVMTATEEAVPLGHHYMEVSLWEMYLKKHSV